MAELATKPPPDGFLPHDRKSAVTNPWEPLFSRRTPGVVEIGVWLSPAHCNAREFVHGGVIAALSDAAMGYSCGARLLAEQTQKPPSLVTMNLTVDFVATARVGSWLQVTPRVLKAGRSIGFVDALVTADGLVARASAVFRVLS